MAIGTSKEITVLHSFLIGIRVFGGILILVVCYLQKVNPLESKVVAELPLMVAAGTIQWILVETCSFTSVVKDTFVGLLGTFIRCRVRGDQYLREGVLDCGLLGDVCSRAWSLHRLSLGQLAICQLQNPSRDLLANSVVSRVSKLSLNLVRPR